MDAALHQSTLPPAPESRPAAARLQRPELDCETLRAAIAGEPAALERFVETYERRVFAFVSRAAGRGPHVEDLAQEVFLRALNALPRFEDRGSKVSSWLFRIAVRVLQDERKRRRAIPLQDPDGFSSPEIDPEGQLDQRRRLTQVERLAATLPEEQRVALVLFEFHGLSHREIGQITGARVPTVKTRIFRARRTLEAGLSACTAPSKEQK